ncbi:MAG: hypothetical protein WD225_14580 [Ilumatobacteraceae bacterium]
MRTIYLRNVPDDVAEGLEQLAARADMSVNAFAVRELRDVARRAANAELLDALPDVDIETADIVDALDDARADR